MRRWGTLCVGWGTLCVEWGTLCVEWGTLCVEWGTLCAGLPHAEGMGKGSSVCVHVRPTPQTYRCVAIGIRHACDANHMHA